MAWAFSGFSLRRIGITPRAFERPGFTWAAPYTFTPGTTNARVRLPFHVTPLLTSSGLVRPHPKMRS